MVLPLWVSLPYVSLAEFIIIMTCFILFQNPLPRHHDVDYGVLQLFGHLQRLLPQLACTDIGNCSLTSEQKAPKFTRV